MSFKYRVVQDGPNKFVLPKVGAMQCPVTAFLSPELFNGTNEAVWAQAAQATQFPGARAHYLMPDTHLGFSIPIGGVLVTDGTIIQGGSGYDISCGVVYLKMPNLTAADVVDWDARTRWVTEVERRVGLGVGVGSDMSVKADIGDIYRYGAKAIGVSAEICERQFIPVGPEFDEHAIQKAHSKAVPQLGSVGGGNHFIEMQVDRDDGSVWVMVHCGSRGVGYKTAEHFFYEGAALRGLLKKNREQSWLHADEPMGRQYWAHHNACANWAIVNRHTIVRAVQAATHSVFADTPTVFYEISHNLVQEETILLPDGSTETGFVHRKGATRAFPAGHPSLVGTPWAETGHPCLIPGSMMAGAAIMYPLKDAYKSACSVNHGSGRVSSRGDAKREWKPLQDEVNAEMRNVQRQFGPGGVSITGIASNHQDKIPVDECGHAYKDLDAVLKVLVDNGIARMEHRLYPVANLKGTD